MGLGGHLDAIFPCEALIAAWNVEQIFVGIGGDENGGDLLFEVTFDDLQDDTHVENATNIIILL